MCSLEASQSVANSFNRTKWNWNFHFLLFFFWSPMLLIVLNGIEILLILLLLRPVMLLIVLNGIEICVAVSLYELPRLLIVLNGIEMIQFLHNALPSWSFNRTKWNWNSMSWPEVFASITFNRTKWNWNIFEVSASS